MPSRPDFEMMQASVHADGVTETYDRWAPVYDAVFGPVLNLARRRTIRSLPAAAREILEVGVGTGLSLPHYPSRAAVTGIDLSDSMLERARRRARREGLENIRALLQMDAAHLTFGGNSFDCAVAMFVMTVVPDPAATMAQMRRVVRPGGRILCVSHFVPESGLGKTLGTLLAPLCRPLGWDTTVSVAQVASLPGIRLVSDQSAAFGGFWRLLTFEVVK